MRNFLNKLYYYTAVVAGLCLVAMTLLILAQIVGRWFGIIIPSTEDFSGFLLASSFALSLGYSFKRAALIRVTLLISHLFGGTRRFIETMAMIIMTLIAGFLAYYFGFLVYESYEFNEVSQGYVEIDIWLVQLPVFVGLLVFFIAVFDDFILLITSGKPSYIECEEESSV